MKMNVTESFLERSDFFRGGLKIPVNGYDAYDRLIEQQIVGGAAPAGSPLPGRYCRNLPIFGFPRQEALRYFALFFQMRRAFYFINAIAGRSECICALRSSLWDNIFTRDMGLYNQYL